MKLSQLTDTTDGEDDIPLWGWTRFVASSKPNAGAKRRTAGGLLTDGARASLK